MKLLRQQRCRLDFYLGYIDIGEGLLECVSYLVSDSVAYTVSGSSYVDGTVYV